MLDALPASPIEFSQTLQLENYFVTFEKGRKTATTGFQVKDVTLIDTATEPGAPAGSWPRVLTADHADYASNLLTLHDVQLFEFEPTGEARFESARIAKGELAQHVDFRQAALGLAEEQLGNLSFTDLTRMGRDAAKRGDKKRALEYEANRWFKFGLPAMCLPCAVCGAALALRFSRGGSFAGILLSLGVVFVAYAAYTAMKFVALDGRLPSLLAASLPPAGFLALALIDLRRQE